MSVHRFFWVHRITEVFFSKQFSKTVTCANSGDYFGSGGCYHLVLRGSIRITSGVCVRVELVNTLVAWVSTKYLHNMRYQYTMKPSCHYLKHATSCPKKLQKSSWPTLAGGCWDTSQHLRRATDPLGPPTEWLWPVPESPVGQLQSTSHDSVNTVLLFFSPNIQNKASQQMQTHVLPQHASNVPNCQTVLIIPSIGSVPPL